MLLRESAQAKQRDTVTNLDIDKAIVPRCRQLPLAEAFSGGHDTMRHKLPPFVLAIFGLLLTTLPALAHHSVLAEYDSKKPVVLNGTITRVLWINPHTFWYVDTKDAAGNMKHWQVEGPSHAEW